MEQTGFSDRERGLLAGTLDELRDRLSEQMAYTLEATDVPDGAADAQDIREIEDSEECQHLSALLDLPLATWQAMLERDPDVPHAALRAATQMAMQALGTALDLVTDPVPLSDDVAGQLEAVFAKLGWIHHTLTHRDEGEDADARHG